MKNDSWLSGGKYSKKVLYENDTSDSTSVATKQKKLLKVFAVACGSVTVWLDLVGTCLIVSFSRAMLIGEKLVFELRDSVIPIKSKSMSSFVRNA